MIVAGIEFADWGAGSDEEVETIEERRHLGAKLFEAVAETGEFRNGDGGSEGEAFGDDGFEALEVAGVDD